MTSWKTYRLGDLCDTISDTYKGCADEVVLINTSDVLEGKCLNHTKEPNRNLKGQFKKTFKKYDILYSEIRPANKRFAYIDFDATNYIASTKLMVLRHNEKIEPLYLYYILQSQSIIDELQMLAESRSGTFPQITFAELSRLEVKLPNREVQRQILGILGVIDDKIENNRRINTNLKLQAQALYKQRFVDFEFPNEEGKPYKSSGGKMVDCELGPIPEGWSVIGYCDAVDIKGGGTPPTNNPEFWNGSIPFFTPKDVPSDCFAIHTEKSITEAGLSNCNSKLYAKDTVFITARGTVGKVVMAGCSMAMNQTNYALIGKNELSQYFVYLLTIALVDRLLKKANGAVFNAITTRDFEGEQIVHPTNFVLGKFIDIISPLYQQVLSIAKENETLATLRDALLPKLMNGEIKV